MRLINLPAGPTVALIFILMAIIQVAPILVAARLNEALFSTDRFWFRQRPWEAGGALYDRLFAIRKWKCFLPDGAALFKSGYRKRRLSDFSDANLERFIIESDML